MSLRLRFFALDADEDPVRFRTIPQGTLDAVAAGPARPAALGLDAFTPPVVFLGLLSASDVDEDALGDLCSRLTSHTGRDFDSEPRSTVPLEELATFGDAVDGLPPGAPVVDPAGWLGALRTIVGTCREGYAHLGWELLWDQAGVTDGPDEQPTAAVVAPTEQVRAAIDAFFGLTATEDGH